MKFNDLDPTDWKTCGINTDSLWLIGERDKSGKHANVYHGNFIPQIPNQLIRRFTRPGDVVFEPFMGSGTTLFECERLGRKYIGLDINAEIVKFVRDKATPMLPSHLGVCNSGDSRQVQAQVSAALENFDANGCQFVLLHPPYLNIIKFTEEKEDLSAIADIKEFVPKLKVVIDNALQHLDKNRYFALVIGDVFQNGEVVPLSFYCMDMIKRNFNAKLKGIVVKNIEGNRGKIGQNNIWKYRALKSDYFIFKHEYIFVFKKEF